LVGLAYCGKAFFPKHTSSKGHCLVRRIPKKNRASFYIRLRRIKVEQIKSGVEYAGLTRHPDISGLRRQTQIWGDFQIKVVVYLLESGRFWGRGNLVDKFCPVM